MPEISRETLLLRYHLAKFKKLVYSTDNFQRSLSVSDGNALTFNAYMVGKKWQRTTKNVLFAVSKNF
jgi:hypothetical protein